MILAPELLPDKFGTIVSALSFKNIDNFHVLVLLNCAKLIFPFFPISFYRKFYLNDFEYISSQMI